MASPPRPIPTITLSSEAGYGAVFGTLGVVTLLTLGFFALQSSKKLVEIAGKSVEAAKETYLSARNSQGAVSLTLSYFVSGLGAWVIFAAPEAAVIGGSFALAGYALSTAFPLLLFGLIAPAMRKNVPHGFTQNEYVVSRFGPYVAGVWACVSMFYMFLYLVAELASAGTLASQLSLIPIMEKTFWEGDNVFAPMPLGPILGVSLITLVYTAIGGLPVSILTDRVQGAGILPLVAIIVIGAYAMAGGGDSSRFAEVAGHGVHPLYPDTDYGNSIAIAISLMLGVTCANLVHAGYWQRVWAAESNKAVKIATYLSALLSVFVMLMVGMIGWIAYSHYGANMAVGGAFEIAWLAVPWIVRDFMGEGWSTLVIILGIGMIASTADTLQSAMTALLWPLADRVGSLIPMMASQPAKMGFVIVSMVLINVPAIIIALSGQSILQYFLLADLCAAVVVVPLLLGLWDRTHPMAALAGSIAGAVTLVVVYAVGEDYDEGYDMLVKTQGGIFGRSATYAFCLTPFVAGLVTVGLSLAVPGYKFEGYKTAGTSTAQGGAAAAAVPRQAKSAIPSAQSGAETEVEVMSFSSC